MKKGLNVLVIFLMLASITAGYSACRSAQPKKNSPEGVAVRFMQHLSKFEFEEARKLGTANTGKMIDLLEVLQQLSAEKGIEGIIPKDITIEVVDVKTQGSMAVVTYRGDDGKVQKIDLVKEKGKWLVDMKKENPTGGQSGN